ncbi:hypothetical protein O3M35_009353 [Rhynocoris fuscipes]|uniref:Uncharacterized protein n=1 Tax=Rhynocoris fuscipes TaxID=488301 RepID=A0AAW1D420_9HEMI
MFATHEVVHMSKCAKDGHRRCVAHGEQYIMFSNSQRSMLCVNCFRDTPPEARLHCVDIDTAYTQGCKTLERSLLSVREMQGLVRAGVVACRTLLDELHHNTNTEKSTIHSFCQGMQDAIAKTQAAMLLEVQRQYESKERVLHSQLVSLSSVIPVLQSHLVLCHQFSSMTTKFQFLDLVYPMVDRLNNISQLSQPLRPLQSSQIKTNYKSEFAQSLEPWIGKPLPPIPNAQQSGTSHEDGQDGGAGSLSSIKKQQMAKLKSLDEGQFTNHCRTFENQMKELSTEVTGVKERLTQLQRDVAILKRTAMQPLAKRQSSIAKDCARLGNSLHKLHAELDRTRTVFESVWQGQLTRVRLEQDILQSQISEVVRVRCEVQQLASIAQELEPCVKRLSSQHNLDDINTLLDHITNIHSPDIKYLLQDGDSQKGSTLHSQATTPQPPEKDIKDSTTDISAKSEYVRSQDHRIRGVISHIMDKVHRKDQEHRKKSPIQEDRPGISTMQNVQQQQQQQQQHVITKPERKESVVSTKSISTQSKCGESVGAGGGSATVSAGKSCSMYHTLSAKAAQLQRQTERQSTAVSVDETALLKKCIQEHLEEQAKQQRLTQSRSKSVGKHKEFQDEDSDYQHISEATTVHTRAHVHKSATPPAVYPHSDTEDSVFYPDTPSSGRRSSTDLLDRRKTLVVVIGHGGGMKGKGGRGGMQKQRSWETFPPKRRHHHHHASQQQQSKFCRDPESFRGAFDLNGLKKADSFEGHEEAVRTLVAAVQETRTMRKSKPPPSDQGSA